VTTLVVNDPTLGTITQLLVLQFQDLTPTMVARDLDTLRSFGRSMGCHQQAAVR
jgi:hypothetical protein